MTDQASDESTKSEQAGLRNLINNLPWPAFSLDADECVGTWNAAMSRISGKQKEDVLRKSFKKVIEHVVEVSSRAQIQECIQKAYAGSAASVCELIVMRAGSGQKKTSEMTVRMSPTDSPELECPEAVPPIL